jgi:hypothetical protein
MVMRAMISEKERRRRARQSATSLAEDEELKSRVSEREWQRRAKQRAMSVAHSVERFCVSRTKGERPDSEVSEKERPHRARQRAMSLAQFCQRYSIGRTRAYEELKSGRLRGRKVGRRTIITDDDAEDWMWRLPAMEIAR